ncbi:MAG: hypothetical protein AAF387_10155 [Pseudomonadota bacterium]
MNETEAREEIEALHLFFVDWFGGLIEKDEAVFQMRFAQRFASDCELIQPSGDTLSRQVFFNAVEKSHGSSPDFRIAIRNVRIRFDLPGDYALVSYEEWQRNAVNSTPQDNARAASVLFARDAANGALQWCHIHETWLPEKQTPPERFDF